MNEFKRAKDVLKGIEIAENREKFICEWGDPSEVALYHSDVRMAERKRLIDRLCPDRVCSECNRLRISLKSWVVSKDKESTICRSCFFRVVGSVVGVEYAKSELFGEITYRVGINGSRVSELRYKLDISMRELARQCGWSKGYHRDLEQGKFSTVSQVVAETLIEVFARHGIVCKDVL